MKKIWALIFAIMLLVTGCEKTGDTGEKDTPNGGGETSVPVEISEGEIREILGELLEKSQEVDNIIVFGVFEANENEEVTIENEHGEDVYNPITDKRFASLEDLKEMVQAIYSERVYDSVYANYLYSPWSIFKEMDGKLYSVLAPAGDMEMLEWSLDKIELDYVQGNRVTFFATVKSGDDSYMGRMALIRENGGWKLDSPIHLDAGVPYRPVLNRFMEPDIADREMILAVVKAQYPDEDLDNFFIEIESELSVQRDEVDLDSAFYYAVNLYNGEKLERRLFVPLYDGYETIEPEFSEKGLLRRDFTRNVDEDEDELFAFVTGKNFETPSDYFDFVANFEEARIFESDVALAGSVGQDMLIIVPKYYGDVFIIKNKEGNVMNAIVNQSFMITPSMDGEIIILHGGKEHTITPTSDGKATLPKGIRIDFEYPEALG